MGPSAIRYAGLSARLAEIGREVYDSGDIHSPVPEATEAGESNAHYLRPILAACGLVADLVSGAASLGRLPLTLGGDHSIAMAGPVTTTGRAGAGVVPWIYAPGVLNRPQTSPSPHVRAMLLAAALGVAGDAFADVAYPTPSVTKAALLGVRLLDPGERELIRELGLRVYTMKELDERGVQVCTAEALDYLRGSSFVHVSLDLDDVDPMFAPGVWTPVRGGLSYREAHLALELCSESGLADSLDVVEVNPILDRENETGALAVELVASALGARIL
jgi:arginase